MERSVRVILRAETSGIEAGMGRAARATEAVGTAAQEAARKTTQATKDTENKLRASYQMQAQAEREMAAEMQARSMETRQAWQQVGGVLTVVGGAMTGLMAVVANTGINYNSLRQTATQGLTAVTGSTEAATEQMRKLDEYGQNSWLMRDSLIRAQQNMTGFGIETEKVIPYMDALAEGVAAAGGNNQDFEELAQVMGKVNSSGKITAETFNEFGNRGIDAAQMIGDAMGITAGQVRDDVTSGALDAGAALDALAEGLVMNFEGSSDLVRNTFRGAIDDVTAAFRDLSAIAMAPFVDPEGGGLLTSLIGQAGDLMFLLRDTLPDGLIQVGGLLTGLGGLAALAAGGFLILAPRLVDTWDALGKIGPVGVRAQDVLRGIAGPVGRLAMWGGALGVTAIAASALMRALHDPGVARTAEDVAAALTEMTRAGEGLAAAGLDTVMSDLATIDLGFFEVSTIQAQSLGEALEKVADPSLTDKMSRLFGTFSGVSYMQDYDEIIQSFGDGLAHLADTDLPAAARAFENLATSMEITTDQAAIELMNSLPGLRDSLVATAEAAGLGTDDVTLLGLAMGHIVPEADAAAAAAAGLAGAQGELAVEFDATTSAAEEQDAALQALIETTNAHYDSILSERSALRDLEAAFDTATEAIADNGQTLDITTAAGRANEAALDDIAASALAVTGEMRDMNRPVSEIADVMDDAREEFIKAAVAMGMAEDDAADLATELGLLPRNVYIDVEARMTAEAQIQAFRNRWNGVSIGTAWINIAARDNLSRGMAATGARYTAQARAYYGGYTGGPVMDPSHRRVEYRAYGGPVAGGDGTRDSVPAVGPGGVRYQLDDGEHIWTKAETAAVGGHGAMYELRSLAKAGRLQAALGMYDGGSVSNPGRSYATAPAVMAAQPRGGAAGPVTATLDARSTALLEAVADRPVQVRMDRRVLAESTATAGNYGRSRGQGEGY